MRQENCKPSAAPAVDWAAVRQAYEWGEEPMATLRERFRLTPYQLRKAREAGGWATRPRFAEPAVAPTATRLLPKGTGRRLRYHLKTQMLLLERRLAEAGDPERDARIFAELCRGWSFLAMTEMRARREAAKESRGTRAAEDGAANKKNNNAGFDIREDPDWLRARLLERIHKIRQAAGLCGPRGGGDA